LVSWTSRNSLTLNSKSIRSGGVGMSDNDNIIPYTLIDDKDMQYDIYTNGK